MPIDLTSFGEPGRRSIPGQSIHDQWHAIAEVEMEAAITEVLMLLEDLYCDGSYVEPPVEEARRVCQEFFDEAFDRLTRKPPAGRPARQKLS